MLSVSEPFRVPGQLRSNSVTHVLHFNGPHRICRSASVQLKSKRFPASSRKAPPLSSSTTLCVSFQRHSTGPHWRLLASSLSAATCIASFTARLRVSASLIISTHASRSLSVSACRETVRGTTAAPSVPLPRAPIERENLSPITRELETVVTVVAVSAALAASLSATLAPDQKKRPKKKVSTLGYVLCKRYYRETF